MKEKFFNNFVQNNVKRAAVSFAFQKLDPIVKLILLLVFVIAVSFSIILSSFVILVVKAVTDFQGVITYGDILLGIILTFFISILIGAIIRFVLRKKIDHVRRSIVE